MNKKYYITMAIILIIYVVVFVTGGISVGPIKLEKIHSFDGMMPDVMPKSIKVLIINIATIIIAIIINVFFVMKDRKNNIKKIGLLLIIILSIFLIPIMKKGYGIYVNGSEYITIWKMIY